MDNPPVGRRFNGAKSVITHGLLARETLISSGGGAESREEFDALVEDLRADCRPQGCREEMLVQQIAVCYWRLRRAIRADTAEFSRALHDP